MEDYQCAVGTETERGIVADNLLRKGVSNLTTMRKLSPFIFLSLFLTVPLSAERNNIVQFGRDVFIEAHEHVEDVVVIGGDIVVEGEIDGDAVAVGGSIIVRDVGYIDGDAVSVGGRIEVDRDAEVDGEIVEISGADMFTHFDLWDEFDLDEREVKWGFRIVKFLGFLALAVLLALLLPKQLKAVADTVAFRPARAGVVGSLGLLAIVPLLILLCISIVGIILIPFEFIFVFLAFIFGYISVGMLIGRRLFKAFDRFDMGPIPECVAGLVMLQLVGLVPIAGWLVKTVVYIGGFGGVLQALYQWQQSQKIVPQIEGE